MTKLAPLLRMNVVVFGVDFRESRVQNDQMLFAYQEALRVLSSRVMLERAVLRVAAAQKRVVRECLVDWHANFQRIWVRSLDSRLLV